MKRALIATVWPRARLGGTTKRYVPLSFAFVPIFSAGINTVAPLIGPPLSVRTRPVITTPCPWAPAVRPASDSNASAATPKTRLDQLDLILSIVHPPLRDWVLVLALSGPCTDSSSACLSDASRHAVSSRVEIDVRSPIRQRSRGRTGREEVSVLRARVARTRRAWARVVAPLNGRGARNVVRTYRSEVGRRMRVERGTGAGRDRRPAGTQGAQGAPAAARLPNATGAAVTAATVTASSHS